MKLWLPFLIYSAYSSYSCSWCAPRTILITSISHVIQSAAVLSSGASKLSSWLWHTMLRHFLSPRSLVLFELAFRLTKSKKVGFQGRMSTISTKLTGSHNVIRETTPNVSNNLWIKGRVNNGSKEHESNRHRSLCIFKKQWRVSRVNKGSR